EVAFDVEYVPRPEYGLIFPLLEPVAGCLVARGGATVLALSTSATFDIEEDNLSAHTRVVVRPDDRVTFTVQARSTAQPPPAAWTHEEALARLDDTTEAWRT